MLADIIGSFKDIVFGPQIDERRNTARARSDFPVSCQTPQGAVLAKLRDISESGARLLIDRKLSKGSAVILVPPKGMGNESKGSKANVVWCRKIGPDYQIGVKFQNKAGRTDWVGELLRELGIRSSAPRQRRKYVRVSGKRATVLNIRGKSHSAEMEDLSVGGALVIVNERVAAGTPVQVSISATAAVPRAELTGTVKGCLSRKDGRFNLSIEFQNLIGPQQKVLAKHLSELMRAHLRA